jgi:hypothetical protein
MVEPMRDGRVRACLLCSYVTVVVGTSQAALHARVRCSMRSMRSMRGGFIFHNRGPSLKVHHCQHLASVTKHDTGVWAGLDVAASVLAFMKVHPHICLHRSSA